MRSKYNIKEDDIVLLYAGRIHQSKGLDLIVEAFLKCYKNNKNLKLFVVGGGYSKYDNQMLEKLLIKKSENLKGNVIKLLKWVNHEDMIYIYSITDISILASINAEGNSLFIMESMACGIPVICTNIGGLPEIITNNDTGILIKKENLRDQLISAIKELVQNKKLRTTIGKSASAYIHKNHEINIMTEKLDKYLQRFIKE